MPCTYSLAVKKNKELNISKCLYFNPCSSGKDLWNQLYENGQFTTSCNNTQEIYGEMGCAIAAQVSLPPSAKIDLEYTLVWNMPVVNFLGKQVSYKKFYSKYFGLANNNAEIVEFIFNNYGKWESDIYNWQKPVLKDKYVIYLLNYFYTFILSRNLPDWYKGALFNETYFVSDGGTVWFTFESDDKDDLR